MKLPMLLATLLGTFSTLASQGRILPGDTVDRMLLSEPAIFEVEIEGGEFAQWIIHEPGLHPRVRLEGPDGQVLLERRGQSLGRTAVTHICRETGRHRLQISMPAELKQGFEIEVRFRQKRPSLEQDEIRLAAEQKVAAAAELRDRWQRDASITAIENAHSAITDYQALGDHEELLWAYRLLADLHYRLLQDEQAVEALKQASQWSAALELPDVQSELAAFYGLILVRSSHLGSAADALKACHTALALGQLTENLSGQAVAYNCLGEVEYYTGNVNQAIENYQKAWRIWRELAPERDAAETALYLAGGFRDIGRVAEAEGMFLEAERLWRVVVDPRGQTLTIIGLGLMAAKRGSHQKALDLLMEARTVTDASGDGFWKGVTDSLIGLVYFQLAEPKIALAHFQQALTAFEAANSFKPLSEIHLEVGRTYRLLGETEKPLVHFERSREIAEQIGDSRVIAVAWKEMALSLEAVGRFDDAERAFEEALPGLEADEFRSGRGAILNGLGRIRLTRGDLSEAEALHREALELSRAADDGFLESESLYYLGQVERDRGRIDSARTIVEKAIETVEKLRINVDDLRLRASYFATVQDYYRLAIDLLMSLHGQDPGAAWAVQAVNLSERARARSLLESLAWGKADSRSAAFVRPLSVKKIQSELDEETVLLEYSLGGERSFLWLITRNNLTTFELPPESEISTMVRSLYETLTERGRGAGRSKLHQADEVSAELLGQLGQILLPFADADVAGKRLVVIPDGTLYYLPFAALLRPADHQPGSAEPEVPRPLVLDHELAVMPSASALAILKQRGRASRTNRKSIAILADPVFERDDPRLALNLVQSPGTTEKPSKLVQALRDFQFGQRINRLIASGHEAQAILDLAPPGSGLLARGFEANRALATSERLKEYKVVHFATHGFLNAKNPDRSGLILSLVDAQGKPQDGFLKLSDVYALDLPVALVVLSACETGLGREVRGEGLMGLVRAFQHAGAQNVLASLWKVDDQATELLMREFYSGLFSQSLSPDAALRQAQMAMWETRRWKAPFYWAAFVLQGDLAELD